MAAPNSTSTVNYPVVNNQQASGVIVLKGLSLAAAGDIAIPVPSLFGGVIAPLAVYTNNSSGTTVSVATATVGLYTQTGQGGTAILTTGALTGQTTQAFNFARAATAAAATVTIQGGVIYANIGTTVAGGVIDLYLTFINCS